MYDISELNSGSLPLVANLHSFLGPGSRRQQVMNFLSPYVRSPFSPPLFFVSHFFIAARNGTDLGNSTSNSGGKSMGYRRQLCHASR